MVIRKRMWHYFECQQCGECCKKIGLPYDAHSLSQIAEFMSISIEAAIKKYYGEIDKAGIHWLSNDNKRTPCPFVQNSEGKSICKIISVQLRFK